MSVFEKLRSGKPYDVRDAEYKKEAHNEFKRCRHICHEINAIDPNEQEKIVALEKELFNGELPDDSFLQPPIYIDCAKCLHLGSNVYANHGLTVMSVGTVTIEDGVMMGPEVGLFTVNHEPKNIRTIMTKEIRIKKNAWIGARVNILPGVTIGENAIVGTGAVVTKDVPDDSVVVGVPAKIVNILK